MSERIQYVAKTVNLRVYSGHSLECALNTFSLEHNHDRKDFSVVKHEEDEDWYSSCKSSILKYYVLNTTNTHKCIYIKKRITSEKTDELAFACRTI